MGGTGAQQTQVPPAPGSRPLPFPRRAGARGPGAGRRREGGGGAAGRVPGPRSASERAHESPARPPRSPRSRSRPAPPALRDRPRLPPAASRGTGLPRVVPARLRAPRCPRGGRGSRGRPQPEGITRDRAVLAQKPDPAPWDADSREAPAFIMRRTYPLKRIMESDHPIQFKDCVSSKVTWPWKPVTVLWRGLNQHSWRDHMDKHSGQELRLLADSQDQPPDFMIAAEALANTSIMSHTYYFVL
ncbi:uncharacterized protein LOC123616192 [Camelus bactrianus]|uniref:Uncharacterized protein LOC123616192 n=1 Tax=Camelus bactrianus TaxID=9837 RepID=A0AC58PFI8_CAMBA